MWLQIEKNVKMQSSDIITIQVHQNLDLQVHDVYGKHVGGWHENRLSC